MLSRIIEHEITAAPYLYLAVNVGNLGGRDVIPIDQDDDGDPNIFNLSINPPVPVEQAVAGIICIALIYFAT